MSSDFEHYKEIYTKKKSYIRNPEAMNTEYVPDKLLYRENQLDKIWLDICDLADNVQIAKTPTIFGPPGVGKTAVVKHIVSKVLPFYCDSIDLKPIVLYLRCNTHTEYSIIHSMLEKLKIKRPKRGIEIDLLYQDLENELERIKRNFLVVLDEIDKYIIRGYNKRIIFNLNRMPYMNMILIGNDLSFLDSLDASTKSSFSKDPIHMKRYNRVQLRKIVRERADIISSVEGFIPDGACDYISLLSWREGGDARFAIKLLATSIELAISKGVVDEKIINTARNSMNLNELKESIYDLSPYETLALTTLFVFDNGKKLDTTSLHQRYEQVCRTTPFSPVGLKQFKRYLFQIESIGLLEKDFVGKGWSKGTSNKYKFRAQKDIQEIIVEKIHKELGIDALKMREEIKKGNLLL